MSKAPTPQLSCAATLLVGLLVGFGFGSIHNSTSRVIDVAPDSTKVLMAAYDQSGAEYTQPVANVAPMVRHHQKSVLVPLKHDKRALILNATVDGQKSASFILDTGATYTSISEDLAKELGYNLSSAKRITITTANGRVQMPKIVLKELTINGYTVRNVEATVMPMPESVPFQGLLGLSFVNNQRITIDSQAKHIVLEPTSVSLKEQIASGIGEP